MPNLKRGERKKVPKYIIVFKTDNLNKWNNIE